MAVVIAGLIGTLFWQNIILKKSDSQGDASSKVDTGTKKENPSTAPDPVAEAKIGISKALNTDTYSDLKNYTASSVDSAIAYSDGINNGITGEKLASNIHQYFIDFAKNNMRDPVTGWKLEDFDTTTNDTLKKTAADTTSFDFKGAYVAIGNAPADNLFVAFRLNAQGKITHAFYGTML